MWRLMTALSLGALAVCASTLADTGPKEPTPAGTLVLAQAGEPRSGTLLAPPAWFDRQFQLFEDAIGTNKNLVDQQIKDKFGSWLKEKEFDETWFQAPDKWVQACDFLEREGMDDEKFKSLFGSTCLQLYSATSMGTNAAVNYFCGLGTAQTCGAPATCPLRSSMACKKDTCCCSTYENRCSRNCVFYYQVVKNGDSPPNCP